MKLLGPKLGNNVIGKNITKFNNCYCLVLKVNLLKFAFFLAQGTDTAFRIKILLKYHLWEEKTFFSQCEEYMYMCVCVCIYIYIFFFYHGPYQRQPPIHPSAPFTRIMKIRILSFISIT